MKWFTIKKMMASKEVKDVSSPAIRTLLWRNIIMEKPFWLCGVGQEDGVARST